MRGSSERRRGTVLADRRGYILAGAIVLTFALVLIGTAFFALAGGESAMTQSDLETNRAFWLAEAGKERAIGWMKRQNHPPSDDTHIYANEAGPDGGAYSVTVRVDSSAIYSAEKVFILESLGESKGRQRRIVQRIRMTSFAGFSYFTDDETSPQGQNVWFISADAIAGRMHSNGTFHIDGSPRFLGHVTSASDHMVGYPNYTVRGPGDWPVGGNNPHFGDGFDLSVERIPMPTQTLDLRQEALNGGLYMAPTSRVQIGRRGNGTAGIQDPAWMRYQDVPPAVDTLWTSVSISSLASGVAYCDNSVEVSGTLDGELTIGARGDIVIVDDVRYRASDPDGTPQLGCNDMLGLVAGGNIRYAENPNTDNLVVDAIMMALNTSITADNYNNGHRRGMLTVWGGLVQKKRGAVGTFRSDGTVSSGYVKNYNYDSRVTGHTPPAFPLTGSYERLDWAETWNEDIQF
jgi:hypothetical protein